jgi:hypothetical protein
MSDFSDDTGAMAPPPPPPPSAGGGGAIPQRSLGEILTTAFELYRANASKLITLVAVVVIPLTLLIAIFTEVLVSNAGQAVRTTFDPETGELTSATVDTTSFGAAILLGLLTALLAAVIQQLLTGALTRGAAGSLLGRPVDVKASYGYALSRLWGLIGLAILVGLVVGIGFVLFIIPGIIFLGFLAVATPAFVVERLGVTAAMSRSWNLVRGHWWHTLFVIAVAAIIAGVVGQVLGAIGGRSFFGVWITSAIAQIITAPFVALVGVVLYVDLRARREALTGDLLGAELDRA